MRVISPLLAITTGIALIILASPVKSQSGKGSLFDFGQATCTYKKKLGNPPNEVATMAMIQGIAGDPQALNSWRDHTGGDTYWGNVQAGKVVLAFLDWVKTQESDKLGEILLAEVNRQC